MNNIERQLKLEEESIALGVERYMERLEKGELSDMPAGLLLMKHAVQPMAEAIEQYIENTRRQKSTMTILNLLSQLKPMDVAYLTLRRVVDSMTSREMFQTVCTKVAQDVVDHAEYHKYKEQAPGHLHVVEKNLSPVATEGHKRKVIMRAKRGVGVEDTPYTVAELAKIGSRLIQICTESTGLCTVTLHQWSVSKRANILEPTEKIAQWLDTTHATHSMMNPMHLPMLCPPKDWTTPFDGGYLSDARPLRMPLVRTYDKRILRDLAAHRMPEVYQAVNNLQKTAWRVNRYILGVAEELWKTGVAVGPNGKYLPSAVNEPLPPKPWSSDEEYERMLVEDKERVLQWKKAASLVHERNATIKSRRLATVQKFWLANKFKDEPEIFFIWWLDWRSRAYCHVSGMSPQGDDLGASLLEFSKGHRLGKEGAYALACSLAGDFGVDKVSLEDRVKWVKEHTQAILDCAENPLDNLWWTDADKPFHFLRACKEWAGYMAEGEDYVSRLPCQQDGSCNGIQHFAAMRKDVRGGSAVNLLPHEKPADIYNEVADVVREVVVKKAIEGDVFALWWQDKVTRKIVKRGVMTTPYGVSQKGMIDQIKEELEKQGVTFDPASAEDQKLDAYTVSKWLGEILYECIGQVIVSSRETMEWIKGIVKATGANTDIIWHTPIGFRVTQKYQKVDTIRVETYWQDVRITMNLNQRRDEVDSRKMLAAVASCFVHSFDAAHLLKTVNAMADQGVTDFSPIHDSYGVHCCFVPMLHATLRDEFIKMYEKGDTLEKFREDLLKHTDDPSKLAPVPSNGSLDLNLVRSSLYFFA